MSTLLLVVLWPALTLADSGDVPGARLFALHCAACHGTDARGTGSVGSALSESPADLTTLTLRNGGVFPLAETVTKIDGRTKVGAHGTTMPVYGFFFEGPAETVQASNGESIETTQAIAQIVRWLVSVQR